MRSTTAALFFASCAMGAIAAAALMPRSQRIGFFDATRVVAESRRAQEMLVAANKAVDAPRAAVRRADEAAGRAGEADAARLSAAAVDARAQLEQAVERERQRVEASLQALMATAAGVLAGQRRMSMVFPSRAAYADPGTDPTSDVIAAIDGGGGELARAREQLREAGMRVKNLEAAARDGGSK